MSDSQDSDDAKDPRTYALIGAAMEVHRHLGCGFLEAVYQEALAIELDHRSIPHEQNVELPVYYKRRPLATYYRADFLCFGQLIVELKAHIKLTSIDEAQWINYLKATGHQVGILLNFGASSLGWQRIVLSQ